MTRFRLRLLGLLAVIAAAGCGDGNKPSAAGELTVSYVQGGIPAGAILLTITGGRIDAVTGNLPGVEAAFASPATGTTKILVSGVLASGDLLRIRVPDVNIAYTVSVEQVANALTFELVNPAGYSLTVRSDGIQALGR